jgi:hypothetical protein
MTYGEEVLQVALLGAVVGHAGLQPHEQNFAAKCCFKEPSEQIMYVE